MAASDQADETAHTTSVPVAGRVLLVDGDDLLRDSVARTLVRMGHVVTPASESAAGVAQLRRAEYDVILVDLQTSGVSGVELLKTVRALCIDIPVVLMTSYAGTRTAAEAMRRGAYAYLQKPFETEDLLLLVERALTHTRLQRENCLLREVVGFDQPAPPLVGSSKAIALMRDAITRIAAETSTVLVRGERGTGKELVARHIHDLSLRRTQPFLTIRCTAFNDALLERELFGYEASAFLGAHNRRRGRLEMAEGGTLLLDEICGMSRALQSRILEILINRRFRRVGGGTALPVNVRAIVSTSRQVEDAVARGTLHEDLYEYLRDATVEIPPLRERREDIPDLVRHFLHRIARGEGQPFRHIEPAALRLLQKFRWPGNVQELKQLVGRAAVLETQPGVIRASTIAPWLQTTTDMNGVLDPLDNLPLAEVEKRVILETLAKFEGHRAKTAGALGIGLRTLGIKLKKWRQDGELAELPFV